VVLLAVSVIIVVFRSFFFCYGEMEDGFLKEMCASCAMRCDADADVTPSPGNWEHENQIILEN
jgi:hypothetical protein